MIKPEMVPKDAMYAAWKAMNAGMTLNDAIAAALNAWPGKDIVGYGPPFYGIDLILPLPQEGGDAEA